MFRFTIRELVLWLTVCVAMFLGGRYWDLAAKQFSKPQELRGNVLRLSRGSSGAINTESPHDRLVVNDPALISVAPMTPTRFVVTAKAKGTTTVTVWEHKTGRPQKYEILVDDQ